jgi:hypothetical protein
MGRKRILLDPVRVKLNLHREDYEYIKEVYSLAGAGPAIRALVRAHVHALRNKRTSEETGLVKHLELELGDE